MAHPSSSRDSNLTVLFGILAGIGLIGMFVLVLIRARMVKSLADLDNSLEIQRLSGIDLRRRLDEVNRALKGERDRATSALDRLSTVQADCDRLTQSLKDQVTGVQHQAQELDDKLELQRQEFLQHEHDLVSEIEECRADVKDLYDDLKAAHTNLDQQTELAEAWKRAYTEEAHSHGNTAEELQGAVAALSAHVAAARDVPQMRFPASAAEGDLINTHHPHPAHHPPPPQAQPVPAAQPAQRQPAATGTMDDMARAEAALRRANAPVDPGAPL